MKKILLLILLYTSLGLSYNSNLNGFNAINKGLEGVSNRVKHGLNVTGEAIKDNTISAINVIKQKTKQIDKESLRKYLYLYYAVLAIYILNKTSDTIFIG